MSLSTRHLLGIKDLNASDISQILDTAREFKEVLQRPIKKSSFAPGSNHSQSFLREFHADADIF